MPLSKLHAGPAGDLLAQLGATVLVGAQVVGIQADGAGYEVRLDRSAAAEASQERGGARAQGAAGSSGAGGRRPSSIHADGIVLAVPAWEAAAIAPAELTAQAARWSQLRPSPVISLHVVYGERVTRLPFAAVAGAPVRFVVERARPRDCALASTWPRPCPQPVSYVDLPASQLRADLLPELERLFPAAAETEVQDFFVTRERRALIRQVPGAAQLRVSQPAAVAGVAVAGAWTDTGWPDSMEGAVRSGHARPQSCWPISGRAAEPAGEAAGRRGEHYGGRCPGAEHSAEPGSRDMTSTGAGPPVVQRAAAAAAVQRASRALLGRQDSEGWWISPPAVDVTIDAEAVLVREFLGVGSPELTSAAAQRIRSLQQPDGSWSSAAGPGRAGDLSASVLAYLVLPSRGRLARRLPPGRRGRLDQGLGRLGRGWSSDQGLAGQLRAHRVGERGRSRS